MDSSGRQASGAQHAARNRGVGEARGTSEVLWMHLNAVHFERGITERLAMGGWHATQKRTINIEEKEHV